MATNELVIKINGDVKDFQSALSKAEKETENLSRTLSKTAKISGLAFAGVTASIGGMVAQAGKMERIHTQFEVLTGNVKDAEKAMSDLQEFSAKTPFQFEDIAKAGQQLLGFGFAADELKDRLQEIGDVAAASNTPINELSLIFGQVSAAGKLTGERLLQLQERAIPIGPALAKTMGVAETSIRDLVSKGKVDFDTFQKAFQSLSQEGGKAFGGMEKQSKTLEGQLSTLKDNFSLVFNEIGKHFLPIVKQATTALIGFLQYVREHPEIAEFAAKVLAVGAALTGIVATVATAGVVFLKLRAGMQAAALAMKGISLSVKGLVGATGIGLLLILATEIYLNWSSIWPRMQAVYQAFVNNITNLTQNLGKILKGAFTFDVEMIKEGVAGAKNAFVEGYEEYGDIVDEKMRAQAEKEIAIETEKHEKVKQVRQSAHERDLEEREERFNELLEQNEEFKELDDEQKALFLEENKEREIANTETEKSARRKVALERFKEQQRSNNLYLKEQIKFGTAYATINKTMRSEEFQGSKRAFGELAQLQQSENSKLKSIGKVAALANNAIKTAEAAMNIYAGFATIPIVGPALGVAGAAAAIAFGAEQAGKIQAAQRGGLMEGGIRGRDSIPVLTEPGELVVPRLNFNDVISAEARRQIDEGEFGEGEGGGTQTMVMIGFDGDEASQVLTAQQIEDTALGINREG